MESIKDIKKTIEDIKQYILLGTISNKFRWKFNRDDEEIIEYRFSYPTTILQVTKEKIIFISSNKLGFPIEIEMPSDEKFYNKIMDYAKYSNCDYEKTQFVCKCLINMLTSCNILNK